MSLLLLLNLRERLLLRGASLVVLKQNEKGKGLVDQREFQKTRLLPVALYTRVDSPLLQYNSNLVLSLSQQCIGSCDLMVSNQTEDDNGNVLFGGLKNETDMQFYQKDERYSAK